MSEKKNIDRLFQEKFKDFDAAPPEGLWQNIEAELKKDEKRKVIPLWFRLSGVAAIFIIGLLLTLPFINEPDAETNPVVIEETPQPTPENELQTTPDNGRIPASVNEAVTDAGNKSNEGTTSNGSRRTPSVSDKGITPSGNYANNSSAVVYDKNADRKESGQGKSGNVMQQDIQNSSEGLAGTNNNNDKNNLNNNQENTVNPQKQETLNEVQNSGSEVAVQQNSSENNNSNNVDTDSDGKISAEERDRVLQEALNRAQKSELALTETPEDTTAVGQENELEKLLKEKEGDKDDKEEDAVAEAAQSQKWNVRTQVAPVFYNSLTEGSPIDPQFASNSKNFDSALSYGVGIDYVINDKLSVRTSVNTLTMSYDTNNVEFFPSLSRQTNNVSAQAGTANIVVQNQSAAPAAVQFFADNTFVNQKFYGSMVQKMGYIEVPLEMSYKLLNKKFGIELIGGVSTLFLNENNISVISEQGYSTEVGEASNLNNVNFSTNVGIGFKYRFWKSLEANFEPMFKYQVNTFSSGSGNFKPYVIGLYSGISYRF